MRFAREFHQNDFEQFKLCPRMFYYREVLGVDPERTSESALAGAAMHTNLAKAHTDKLWMERAGVAPSVVTKVTGHEAKASTDAMPLSVMPIFRRPSRS